MRKIDFGTVLKESITYHSNYLLAYHRTSMGDALGIIDTGFKPGYGSMYGKGFYLTYDLSSQLKSNMTHYGDTLLKCRINPKNLLIFDYNISKSVFGDKYTLNDQLIDHYRIYHDTIDLPRNIFNWSKMLEKTLDEPSYSADVAYNNFVDSYVKNGICSIRGVRGIIFTGNHDGNVVVSYAYDTAIPFEYAKTDYDGKIIDYEVGSDGVISTGKKLPNGGWIPAKDMGKVQSRADEAEILLDYFKGTVKSIDTPEGYSLKDFQKDFPWFVKAKVEEAEIIISEDKEFIWNKGTWVSGQWYGDVWLNGIWKKGKWHKGNFSGGDWSYGNFLGGIFSGGIWHDGIWSGGEWKEDIGTMGTSIPRWKTGEIKTAKRFIISTEPPLNESVYIDSIIDGLYNIKYSHVLNESFKYYDLSKQEQDALYSNFRDSYQKAVGASWDQGKFESRAVAWTFFGDKTGGIAARKQNSGMYKLVATFGSPKSIIGAFTQMQVEVGRDPIWGVMTQNLAIMLEKRSGGEFKQPPKLFVKTLIPRIKNIFGDVVHSVEKDGGIVVDTPAGLMTKYFIANKAYYTYMLDQMENRSDSLPIPKPIIKILIGILRKFM